MIDSGFYNRDCMIAMKQFPDKFFDLALVDPEYGRKEHGGKNRSGFVKQSNGARIFVSDGGYTKKSWDSKPVDSEYFNELKRVSKNQIVWGVNYYERYLGIGRIVWDKCNDGSDQSDCEIAYCSMHDTVRIFRYMWRGMFQGKSISEGTVQQGNKALNERRTHPTQKPIALYTWLLQNYAKRGDKILDTHVGSASSLIACHRMGFEAWGFELDQSYFKAASERLEKEKSQGRLFEPEQVQSPQQQSLI